MPRREEHQQYDKEKIAKSTEAPELQLTIRRIHSPSSTNTVSTKVEINNIKEGINNQKTSYSTRKTYQARQLKGNKPITKPPINRHNHEKSLQLHEQLHYIIKLVITVI